jgi:uncharacterized membrane protein YheB (UPF0754 family)
MLSPKKLDLISDLMYAIDDFVDTKIRESSSDCYWADQSYEARKRIQELLIKILIEDEENDDDD